MTQHERLDRLFTQHGGIVKTSQALEAGVPKPTFYAYVRERGMEQAAHGVFVSPDSWTDGMYLLHLRCGQAVFSHETALFFHDLTDREPMQYSITVKTGYNPSNLKADGIQVYTIKKELHSVGITTMQTNFGHSVPVYDMERTICDLIRSRSSVEVQTFQDALKQYAHRRDKNLRLLMQYAALFRVEKILRQYLEVLL
jgi:predicted transcriptional regulator of viral defense system